jgi:hypothetical protein
MSTPCTNCPNRHWIGKELGASKSEAKIKAAKENGKKGGRPKKDVHVECRNLYLNVKTKYFLEILKSIKTEEYRLINDFWRKKLIGRNYENVIIRDGYKKGDKNKVVKGYGGILIKTIKHEHFGENYVDVFAIQLID